jgi:hypothetical protein
MLIELRRLSQAWILAQVLLAVHSGMGKKIDHFRCESGRWN